MIKSLLIPFFIILFITSINLYAQCTDPEPYILPEQDTVCGIVHHISVENVQGTGVWTFFVDGEPMSPTPAVEPSPTSPDITITIGSYPGNLIEVECVWTETINEGGEICIGTASQTVLFAKMPLSNVVVDPIAEVCGDSYTFDADTTGYGWATGTWISPNENAIFNNENIPDATVEIISNQIFGDSAYVNLPFVWEMNNMNCIGRDTFNVVFYQKPSPFAGFDDTVCGNNYITGAEFSIPESGEYTPTGAWSVYSNPNPSAAANISPANTNIANITVSHNGAWEFVFRENNSNATFCYDTDTVMIEFVEQPVAYAGEDQHVCGLCTQLNAFGSGTWLPNGASYDHPNNPNATVCVNTYGTYEFIWKVTNSETMDFECINMDTVTVTFWTEPEAVILTDEADTTTCGLTFDNLRAQNPGTGITGYWWSPSEGDYWPSPIEYNSTVTVSAYGYHDFYWIVTNGPTFQPDFCVDTAGPHTVHFIENPVANAGNDTIICGYSGQLNAIPSVGTGVWITQNPDLVTFQNANNPNTEINSQVLNTGNSTHPYFNIVWLEDNTNGCTDIDTIKVVFARVPSSDFGVIPSKCFGESATLVAHDDTLQHYNWNFHGGIVDSIAPANLQGGLYMYFVYWTNEDTTNTVSLVTTNYWGCQSEPTYNYVYTTFIPEFDVSIINDTCLLGKGAIIFEDTIATNSFYWLDSEFGPEPNTQITEVYDLLEGYYDIRARYRSPHDNYYHYYISIFGNAMCTDTITYYVPNYSYFDLICPEDIYITENDVIILDGANPEGGIFYLNGNEISQFNSQEYSDGIYTVMYHYFDENSDCASVCYFNIVVDTETYALTINKLEFSVYPNPATDILFVENIPHNSQIIIYDVTGKIIISMIGDAYNEIDISGFEPGMYIISVIDNNTSFGTRNIIKY